MLQLLKSIGNTLIIPNKGHLTSSYLTIPFLITGFLTCVHLVAAKSFYQDVTLRCDHVCPVGFRVIPVNGRNSITAPYLPLCLVAFSWLLQGGYNAAIGDIVRILKPTTRLIDGFYSLVSGRDTGWSHIHLLARLLAKRDVESDGKGRSHHS